MPFVLAYSPDEGLVLVVSFVLALLSWAWWFRDLSASSALRRTPDVRGVVSLAPVAGLLVVLAVLKTAASFDVRDSVPYLFQYAVLGAAWIGVGARTFRWLGLSPRDDVAERGNAAAAVALAGACLGLALCYAGGNIGDGPGWWVVVFASGLATAGFLVAWGLFEKLAHTSDGITIDRDLAAGLRFAGFAVGEGLVLGRAAAGDWVSPVDTVRDFAAVGWPALVILALAILLERTLAPNAEQPRRAPFICGFLPGALLLGLALGWVVAHGSGA